MPSSAAFTVAHLNPRGELLFKAEYHYAQLELLPAVPGIIGQISGEIWRSPEGFEAPIDDRPELLLRLAGNLPQRRDRDFAASR